MNKKSYIFIAIMLIFIVLTPLCSEIKVASAANYEGIIGTTTTTNPFGYGVQRNGFYAAGRYWVFYSTTTAYYISSANGLIWSSATSIGAVENSKGFGIWYNGTHVFYTRSDADASDNFFRMGIPNSDGTITWAAAEQTVYSGAAHSCHYPSISVDTNGYAWIMYNSLDGGLSNGKPKIHKNVKTDGTWLDDPISVSSTVTSAGDASAIGISTQRHLFFANNRLWVFYSDARALPAGWWNSSWASCKKITIDAGDIDADLTNFPVLVYLNSSNIDWTKVQDDLDDLRFTVNNSTLLSYEIENLVTNDEAWIWVKIPAVDDAVNTNFFMYYNNPIATSGEDAENVWDANFVMVQHMDDVTTSTILDSTANNNDGTKKAANEPIETASGKIDDAQSFDGDDDHISCGSGATIDFVSSFTLSSWVYPSADNVWRFYITHYESGVGGYIVAISDGNQIRFSVINGGVNYELLSTVTVLAGSWSYVTVVYDDATDTGTIVINGVTKSASTFLGSSQYTGLLYLGRDKKYNQYAFGGVLDEVRFSNVARSSAWIKASSESENNHLLSYGTEVSTTPYISYRVSTDLGVTWSSATAIRVCDNGTKFDVTTNGTSVWYIYGTEATGVDYYINTGTISGGTISWDSEKSRDVCTGVAGFFPSIAVTTNYVFVSYSGLSTNKIIVFERWDHALTGVSSTSWVYYPAFYQKSIALPRNASDGYWIYENNTYQLNGRDGFGAAAHETVTTRVTQNGGFSAVADASYNIYLAYLSGNDIYYKKLSAGGAWGAETKIVSSVGATSNPVVSYNSGSGKLYVFYPYNNNIYYVVFDGATWSSPYLFVSTTNIVDACINTVRTSSVTGQNGVIYLASDSPYNIISTFIAKFPYYPATRDLQHVGTIVPLSSGNVMAVYCGSPVSGNPIYSRVWNSSTTTWSSESSFGTLIYSYYFSVVAVGNTVWVAYVENTNGISVVSWTGSSWTSPTVLATVDSSNVAITKDGDGNIYVYYAVTSSALIKRFKRTGLTWGSETTYFTLSNVVKTSANLDCFYEHYSTDYFGVLCATKTSSPYDMTLIFTIPDPSNISIVITDMEGCGNWLFADEQYYTFRAVYFHSDGTEYIDTVSMAFTDGVNWINASYNNVDGEFSLDDGGDVVSLKAGTVTSVTGTLTVDFRLLLHSKILDSYDVDLYIWCNSTDAKSPGWEKMATDYFNIYNLGGFVETRITGNAGITPGGDIFELYASYLGAAEVNQTWRNLQSYHAQFSVKFLDSDGKPGQDLMQDEDHYAPPDKYYTVKGDWQLDISIYYCDSYDVWVKGWTLRLVMEEGNKGVQDLWTTLNATWYQGETKISSGLITAFLEEDPQARFTIWVNLWFNQANASTMFGGRVNPYYYGMSYTPGVFIPFAGSWNPMLQNQTNSMGFDRTLDSNNDIISSQSLKLMKVGYKLFRVQNEGNNNFKVVLQQFDLSQPNTIKGNMMGVPTPLPDKTIAPTVGQNILFAPLYAAFQYLGSLLVAALTTVFSLAVLFLDEIASVFGLPNLFSNFFGYITALWDFVAIGMTHITTMLTVIFAFFTGPILTALSWIVLSITRLIELFTIMINILTGAYGWSTDLWTMFSGTDFLILFTYIGIPLYLLSVMQREGIGGVYDRVMAAINVLMFFVNLIVTVVGVVINFITTILSGISTAMSAKPG